MANYCIWCGKEIKKDEVKCPECGKFQQSYQKPWKDFLKNNAKDKFRDKITDKIFSLITAFIKSHVYGTVLTISIVFTVTGAATYAAKADDIKVTKENGEEVAFTEYKEVAAEPFTELVTNETADTLVKMVEAENIDNKVDTEELAGSESNDALNVPEEADGFAADPDYIGSYRLAGIYGSGEDTMTISMYTDFFEETTPGEQAGNVSELRIENSVLVQDNYLVTTDTPNVFTIPNTDYTVAFKRSTGGNYKASVYNDMGTCVISFDSTVKYNDDDVEAYDYTSNNIDDYTINDVEFFIGDVIAETEYYLGPSYAFDIYEDVTGNLKPGSQVMVYGQCLETGWWRVDLGRSGSYPVLYVPMNCVSMP